MRYDPPPGSRVVIYARFSTLHQRQESIEDQVRVCTAVAERNGWTVVAVYSDAARSGTTFVGRSGYFEMMAAADRGEFDVVLVEDMDRLSRQASGAHGVIEEFQALDIAVCTAHGGVVTDMEVAFKAVQNAEFIRNLAKKSRRGVEGAVLAGRQSGRVPYGFKKVFTEDGARGLRAIVEAEADVVRRVFRDCAAGKSIVQICHELTADGIPGPGGRPWRVGALYGNKHKGTGILRNALYKGKTVWGRTKTKRNGRTGSVKHQIVPQDDHVVVDAPELRIVSDELFDAVQQRLADNEVSDEHQFQSRRKAEYLFSGLYRCGVCGSAYHIRHEKMGCVGRLERGVCDNRRRVARTDIEDLIVRALKPRLLTPQYIKPYIAEYRRELRLAIDEWNGGRASLEKEQQRLTKASQNLMADLRDGDLEGAARRAVRDELNRVERDREQLQRRLATTPSHPLTDLSDDAIIARMGRVIDDLQSSLANGDRDATRAQEVLRTLVEKIVIEPIPAEYEDRRGIGPVRITVTGNLSNLLSWSEDDRVVQHASRPESMQGHATVLVDFTIDHFPVDIRMVPTGYETVAVISRMLDDADRPLSKRDLIDALAGTLDEAPDYDEGSRHLSRVNLALRFLLDRDLVRRVGWRMWAGYMWSDAELPLDIVTFEEKRPMTLPMELVEVAKPETFTVRVYRCTKARSENTGMNTITDAARS
ncbi:recombinase family protein [Brevundimonas naejangsanensis]|uniref:recombinase family protein n=1 Tax=Brevundimonas naejangsanensis TaxID=588932 RepID=UPI00106D6C34|nr:recombinase family protein [Brevundimonas naejangsanensis]QBQ49562.1 recombinase family protein [Brevundimonas naejangsanensis]